MTAALLVAGVIVLFAACAGVAVGRDVYTRLHYVAPAGALGSVLVAVAIFAQEGFTQAGLKALLAAAVLALTSPVLTHATARAARTRETGGWQVLPPAEEL